MSTISPVVVTLAQRVCDAARRLGPDGLAVGTAGNISARDPASGLIAVTPAGYPYESMAPSDVAIVDPDGLIVRAPLRPSSELTLHIAIYAARSDVDAIVHAHSPYATAFAVLRRPIPLVCNEGLGVGIASLEVAEFEPPGTPELGAAAVRLLRARPGARAFLLANHGSVAMAADVAAAYRLAAQVEWQARVYHLALAVGQPHVLTQDQMDRINAHYESLPPIDRSPG
jgi:L-fuculose-phosphate aldolase